METLPYTRSCFVCGESNAAGLKLKFTSNGQFVHVEFVPRHEHVGFQKTVHGGVLAAVLDELMVWACAIKTGKFGYCAELTVRYHLPAAPAEPLQGQGEMVEDRGEKVYVAKGELKNTAGEVTATAWGKYLPLKPAEQSELLGDVVPESIGPKNLFALKLKG